MKISTRKLLQSLRGRVKFPHATPCETGVSCDGCGFIYKEKDTMFMGLTYTACYNCAYDITEAVFVSNEKVTVEPKQPVTRYWMMTTSYDWEEVNKALFDSEGQGHYDKFINNRASQTTHSDGSVFQTFQCYNVGAGDMAELLKAMGKK
jgi:hypothetical protein